MPDLDPPLAPAGRCRPRWKVEGAPRVLQETIEAFDTDLPTTTMTRNLT